MPVCTGGHSLRVGGGETITAGPMNVEQVRSALSKVEDRAGKDILATGVVQNLVVKDEEVRMELHYDGAYGMNDRIRIESSISTALKMAGFEKKVSLIPVVKTAP